MARSLWIRSETLARKLSPLDDEITIKPVRYDDKDDSV